MTVANANTRDDVLEQVTIERMLAAVSPDLRVRLKEPKLGKAEELVNKASEYVQARKGPLINGRCVYDRAKPREKGKQIEIDKTGKENLGNGTC